MVALPFVRLGSRTECRCESSIFSEHRHWVNENPYMLQLEKRSLEISKNHFREMLESEDTLSTYCSMCNLAVFGKIGSDECDPLVGVFAAGFGRFMEAQADHGSSGRGALYCFYVERLRLFMQAVDY